MVGLQVLILAIGVRIPVLEPVIFGVVDRHSCRKAIQKTRKHDLGHVFLLESSLLKGL
jgi:hypothetical protein